MKINGIWILDEKGRRVLLRGVNLGGSSKVPRTPNGATHISEGFFQHRDVSFVGRPFPLNEADEHFTRLREWGFTFLRFLVTWEAIEHAGPGKYDTEYLDYLAAVIEKAGEYGMRLFIDPHQDVWGRLCGGDGAPGWTLEKVGFNVQNFKETGAAITHQTYQGPLPWLLWPTNGDKLAAATMFTLFFAGNDFAPKTLIDGEPVQEYLQNHYINAIKQVAERLRGMGHVIGYETMNEPFSGWIGLKDLTHTATIIRQGPLPSPWQSILLGSGFSQKVEIWDKMPKIKRIGYQWLNEGKKRSWQEGKECVWKQNGVWDIDSSGEPRLLRRDYFASVDGNPVRFTDNYYRPFVERFSRSIRQVHPNTFIFIESAPGELKFNWSGAELENTIYAPHWYDLFVMSTKKFSPLIAFDNWRGRIVFLKNVIRRSFAGQLGFYREQSEKQLCGIPVLVGEIGIPFNLYDAKSYRTGDFTAQERAIDRFMKAVEDSISNVIIWNYTADNDNTYGDQWNDEDFSIFSLGQKKDPNDINSGGRALSALIRPYPVATAGLPLSLDFNRKSRSFSFKFSHDPDVDAATEIYVPRYRYPTGYNVSVSDGTWDSDIAKQRLFYRHTNDIKIHEIKISPKSGENS